MPFLSSNAPVSQNWGAGQANFGIAKILTAPILEVPPLVSLLISRLGNNFPVVQILTPSETRLDRQNLRRGIFLAGSEG